MSMEQMEMVDEGDGSALGASPPEQPQVDPQGDPNQQQQKPQQKPQRSLEERIQRAEGAIQRHKQTSQRLYHELEETKRRYAPMETEYQKLQRELAEFRSLKERLAEGDEDALRELGGDFDLLIDRRLDPNLSRYTREARRGLTETERKLQELQEWRAQQEQREQEIQYQRELETLVATVRDGGEERYPDLQIIEPQEVIAIGQHIAPLLARELGRTPTFHEIAQAAQEQVAAYHQRVVSSYQKRMAKQTPAKQTPTPTPTTPTVNGITNRVVTEAASTDKALSPEEKRQRALAIARMRLGED